MRTLRTKGPLLLLLTLAYLCGTGASSDQTGQVISTSSGRVISTSNTSRGALLYVGPDIRNSLLVLIPDEHVAKFPEPIRATYVGKDVTVTGLLTHRAGRAELVVTEPSQIVLGDGPQEPGADPVVRAIERRLSRLESDIQGLRQTISGLQMVTGAQASPSQRQGQPDTTSLHRQVTDLTRRVQDMEDFLAASTARLGK